MADRDPNAPDSEAVNTPESDSQTVESWYSHPSHARVVPYLSSTKWERRKPENAPIRRWMDLADQAMKSQDSEEEEDVGRSS